jgi:tripartite-type tricarboxylate transporter receptor subunit TctC
MPRLLFRHGITVLLCLMAACAHAQTTYPDRPIRFLISTAPGGGTDAIGRVIADALQASLKQPVVPENVPGAGGVVASNQLVRSKPDGYTVMITQNAHTTNPVFFRKLPYDTIKDFTAIATVANSPLVLVAAERTKVKTMHDLLDFAQRNPNEMSFAYAESSTLMALVQLSDATGIKMLKAPYKGTGPAVADVVGGHVNFSITTIASVLPFNTTGKMNFVGVLSSKRSLFLPDVPTLVEQGIPNVEVMGWWGLLGPANMPPSVVEQLNGAVGAALNTLTVRAKIQNQAADIWSGSPQEFEVFRRSEITNLVQLGKKAGIEPD